MRASVYLSALMEGREWYISGSVSILNESGIYSNWAVELECGF